VLVTVMMGMLFQPGSFERHGAADVSPAQIVFWVAFAGFFFGLTYGLLQIVGEQAVFRREYRSGLANRYSFEALGRGLRLDQLTRTLPTMRAYGDTFSGTVAYRWLILAGFTMVLTLATVRVLRRKCSPDTHGRR
jgi:hypothetical protein